MEAVSWELARGVKAFKSLIDIIAEALATNNIADIRHSTGWEWHGYYLEDRKYFVGIEFTDPNRLYFEIQQPLAEEKPELKLGKIEEGKWMNELDLASEEVYFFARSKASQMQCVEEFVKTSLAYAKELAV